MINTGAERLGWTIEELMEKTILAMRSCEESVNQEMETLAWSVYIQRTPCVNTQGVLFCELYGELCDIVEGRRGFTPPAAATPHPPPSGAPVSLRVGRSADLTGHRPVIQHRGPLKGKADGGAPSGERLTGCRGRRKRPGGRFPVCYSMAMM